MRPASPPDPSGSSGHASRRSDRTACVRAVPGAGCLRPHRLRRLLRLRASSWLRPPFALTRPDALVRAQNLPAREDVFALVVFVGREGSLGEAAVKDRQRHLVAASLPALETVADEPDRPEDHSTPEERHPDHHHHPPAGADIAVHAPSVSDRQTDQSHRSHRQSSLVEPAVVRVADDASVLPRAAASWAHAPSNIVRQSAIPANRPAASPAPAEATSLAMGAPAV